jgi:hypothetical protein
MSGWRRLVSRANIFLHPICVVKYRLQQRSRASMNADDFRRIALSMEGAEESSHMGQPDFRVDGRIFATLASAHQGYGNLMLTLEQQHAFVEELPEVFLPIHGGWGRMGMTHIRLAAAQEDVLTGALRTAWKLRVDKNAKSGRKPHAPARPIRAAASRASKQPAITAAKPLKKSAKKSTKTLRRKKR